MDNVPVRFRDCSCPGTPHDGLEGRDDGDIAYLRPFLDFAGGAEALAALSKAQDDPESLPMLIGPVYIKRGVVGWNLLDEAGVAVPCTSEAVAALSWADAYDLADRADDLYGESVLAPLVRRMNEPSKGGRTAPSTRQRRKRSPRVPAQ